MTDNKLIKQKFRSSIKRGTGEAHLIMQNNPTVDFSSDIIKASLKNYAYDGQSEGSRALYLSELIELSKQKDKIRQAILSGLATERQDTWALVQLFDLATIFAKQGHKDAKRAIYKRFFKKIISGSWSCTALRYFLNSSINTSRPSSKNYRNHHYRNFRYVSVKI